MSISLFLDDKRPTPKGFERTYTVQETIELIQDCHVKNIEIEVLSLDNDLGEGEAEGYTVLDWLEEQFYEDDTFQLPNKIIVHSDNAAARERMEMVIARLYGE
ncbi:MAG: hypothetical protein IKZ43_01225 [Acidaminococcaceae bacterium]|nr:hypothetical protein [Acidaminococcaceae bacterium]